MALTFLITGASGFVSRCVTEAAMAHGHRVRGLSRQDNSWKGQTEALAEVIQALKPDVVFHGAGSASVRASVSDPAADRDASVGTWSTLLDAVEKSGLKPQILFPSSAAVYGNPTSFPVSEQAPIDPISPYGRHKAECETLAAEYRQSAGLPVYVVRLFSLFGPGQKRLLVRELFNQAAGEESSISLAGTGNETRDYLDSTAFGRAVVTLAESFGAGRLPLEPWIFNLASGQETPIKNLASQVAAFFGKSADIHCRGESLPGDPVRWVADTSAIRRACPGWTHRSLEESLHETLSIWSAEQKTP